MGVDLKPVRPTKNAPRDEDGKPIWGRYNWRGWEYLRASLNDWGRSDLVEHLSGWNDGELISSKICKQIAQAIEDHLDEVNEEWREDTKMQALLWKTCGGYRQH